MTESIPENDVIISENLKASTYSTEEDIDAETRVVDAPIDKKNKKKKSGAFGIFRAALFMLRKRSRERSGAKKDLAKQERVQVNNNANWTKLVGSVRPLHLQDADQSPPLSPPRVAISEELEEIIPPASPAANINDLVGSVRTSHLQKIAQSPPPSPAVVSEKHTEIVTPESPAASSSSGTMSQYSSAVSLLDLDNSSDEEEEDPDEVFDALTGDEMIDAKAEEFIAQFYKQIELQRTERAHHRHHHSRGI